MQTLEKPQQSGPKQYSERLKDPRWQKKRLEIFELADWKCEDCGRRDKTLEVHHTFYLPGKNPWEYDSGTLMSLCTGCHLWRQSREDAFRERIGRITRDLPPRILEQEVWRIIEEAASRETARLASSFGGSE